MLLAVSKQVNAQVTNSYWLQQTVADLPSEIYASGHTFILE